MAGLPATCCPVTLSSLQPTSGARVMPVCCCSIGPGCAVPVVNVRIDNLKWLVRRGLFQWVLAQGAKPWWKSGLRRLASGLLLKGADRCMAADDGGQL
jgi:hypothetical protein